MDGPTTPHGSHGQETAAPTATRGTADPEDMADPDDTAAQDDTGAPRDTTAPHDPEPPRSPAPPGAPPGTPASAHAPVTDLRRRAGRTPRQLRFAPGDVVVVSGLPGSGKSTLMRRAVSGPRIDSQDTRERWSRRMPRFLPYALYRPLVRIAHYVRLRRTLRLGTSLVVHDCGTQVWVRRWLARAAARRAATLHLLLLDVGPEAARAGQSARGRAVSRYAFMRHRRAVTRLVHTLAAGRLPAGCASAVLLDRQAADALRIIGFGGETRAGTAVGLGCQPQPPPRP